MPIDQESVRIGGTVSNAGCTGSIDVEFDLNISKCESLRSGNEMFDGPNTHKQKLTRKISPFSIRFQNALFQP